jgi:plastocyanin
MQRFLLGAAIGLIASVALPVPAVAATSSAQIVGCAATTWCFSPNPIQVSVGTAITWSNTTAPNHTATSDPGSAFSFDTGVIGSGHTSAPIVFSRPGTFAYHCSIHPFMQGTIIVTAAASATPTPSARVTSAPTRTNNLAQSGGGPTLLAASLIGSLALLLGFALLGTSRLRRQRPQAARQVVRKSPKQ